jgi:CubicO group peptidase (beta-lactamase class C family)
MRLIATVTAVSFWLFGSLVWTQTVAAPSPSGVQAWRAPILPQMFILTPLPASTAEATSPESAIQTITSDAMKRYQLKSIIVQVTSDGKSVYTGALGESMTGVPATPDMHFRAGAMAFTYMATMLMELVDQEKQKVQLDDKLSKFFPDLPDADRITLRNLANMTSGYADYVYQPEVLHGVVFEPFRQWSPEELIQIGTSQPMMFEPGTNWGYSHTNYVILGRVLEKITGMPLAEAMQKYIFGPMDLHQTQSFNTPQVPAPVLHTFSSERRADLGVASNVPFYEESTFWNPSWTTAEGAVQTTDITDMTKTMAAVGSGKILSKTSWEAQVGPTLVGFGHADPKCPVCRQNSPEFNYGLGVLNIGPWIAQSKGFAGCDAMVGYLPSKKLSIAVVVTYGPGAFDEKGNFKNSDVSRKIFALLTNALAPDTLPKQVSKDLLQTK